LARKEPKQITNKMLDRFTCGAKGMGTVRIGDYVADSDEIATLASRWGGGITGDTCTNSGQLFPTLYDIRAEQYTNAFAEGFKEHIGRAASPVGKLFVKHFTGKLWHNNLDLTIFLDIILHANSMTIADMVADLV
jgi:hypothetical protein